MDIVQSIGFFVTLFVSFFSAYFVVRKLGQWVPIYDKDKFRAFVEALMSGDRTDTSFIRFRNVSHICIQIRDKYSLSNNEVSIILILLAILFGVAFVKINVGIYSRLCSAFELTDGAAVIVALSSMFFQVVAYTSMYLFQEGLLKVVCNFEYAPNSKSLTLRKAIPGNGPVRYKVITPAVVLLVTPIIILF